MLPRHQKFLEELPKNGNKVLPSAVKAGYSESYARKGGKNLYRTALKAQANEIIQMVDNNKVDKKQVQKLMSDIVGMSPDVIMERLRNIATQEKDYGTALKVLGVLARQHGVEMDSEAPKITIPTLNIMSRATNPVVNPQEQGRTINIVGNLLDNGIDEGMGGMGEPDTTSELS